ncbi:phage tail protein [Chitinivorax sp. B]|uniref:phage tail protein n=1 Tax=Chitinivorax sp. B TaxID=2502235 RepID=UPI0010F976C2|nr:phage tail protein [Chitinivorax sp. B]
MNKPASLRATLEAALPELAANPDHLVIYIESGQIAAGLGGPSFEYRYKVTVGLLDFAGHTDRVMVPVLQWLRQYQPSLLQNPDTAREAIQFEAEILNHSSYDLKLQIQLSEPVQVKQQGDTLQAIHLPEPDLGERWPMPNPLQIIANGQVIDG